MADQGDTEPGSFWGRVLASFDAGAGPELPPEQIDGEAYADYRVRMGVPDGGDIFGADYADSSGLPDWRHPPTNASEPTQLERWAQDERPDLAIPETTILHGFEPAKPRSHASPYKL